MLMRADKKCLLHTGETCHNCHGLGWIPNSGDRVTWDEVKALAPYRKIQVSKDGHSPWYVINSYVVDSGLNLDYPGRYYRVVDFNLEESSEDFANKKFYRDYLHTNHSLGTYVLGFEDGVEWARNEKK